MEDIKKIKEYFKIHRQEFLDDIMEFIQIPSVNEPEKPNMPFGEKNAEILALAKSRAEKFGFNVRVLENYVVIIDLNEKSTQLDILAHLDVVPPGEGWNVTKPFVPLIRNGKLYGRGASDDKGPAIAALYALRAIKELEIPVNWNTRVILGADEETACRDIAYYYERYEEAPCSFSPDGEYPIINIEKGGLYTKYTATWEEDKKLPRVLSVKGGVAGNAVPSKAKAIVQGIPKHILNNMCINIQKETDIQFCISKRKQTDEWEIVSIGESTHASTPWEGKNAITGLLKFLTELPMADSKGFSTLCELYKMFPHDDFYGQAAGIAQSDKNSGVLTLGTHKIEYNLTGLIGSIDCRAPISASKETVLDILQQKMMEIGIELDPSSRMTLPHYVAEESSFVQVLLNCYEEMMEELGHCIAIGGGTYVHHLKNGVAFGCMKPETDYHIHGADEFLVIDEIIKSAELFTLVIARICK